MRHVVRFAFLLGLSTSMTVLFALDPPQQQDRTNRPAQDQQTREQKKIAEPARKEAVSREALSKEIGSKDSASERLDRRGSRMKERNRQIDDMVNRPKK